MTVAHGLLLLILLPAVLPWLVMGLLRQWDWRRAALVTGGGVVVLALGTLALLVSSETVPGLSAADSSGVSDVATWQVWRNWLPDATASQGPLLSVTLRGTTDSLLLIATLGLATTALAARMAGRNRQDASSLCLMQALAVAFWLIDELATWLILQGLLVAASGWLLCRSSMGRSPAGTGSRDATPRNFWVLLTVGDVACLFVAVLLSVEAQVASGSQAVEWDAITAVTTRMPAVTALIGTLIWLALHGRLLQFPGGIVADSLARHRPLPIALLTVFVLGPISWRWLQVAAPWWHAAPASSQLVVSTATLTGVLAAWFATCSHLPTARLLWLLSWSWSLLAMTQVSAAPLAAPADIANWGHTGTMLVMVSLLAGCLGLLGIRESRDRLPKFTTLDSGDAAFRFAQSSGSVSIHRVSWSNFTHNPHSAVVEPQWSEWTASATGWPATAEPDEPTTTAGRTTILCAAILVGVTAALGHRPNNSLGVWDGIDGLRWFSIFLAGFAVAGLRTRSKAMAPSHAESRAAAIRGAGLSLLPLAALVLPGLVSVRQELWSLPAVVGLSVALLGAGWGLRRSRQRHAAHSERPGLWGRLGMRRLYVSWWLVFPLNWSLRAAAQFLWFCEEVVWERWMLGLGQRCTQWGYDADVDLPHSSPQFFALSLTLGVTAVLLTLLWQQ